MLTDLIDTVAPAARRRLGRDVHAAVLAARSAADDGNFIGPFQTVHQLSAARGVSLCSCCLTSLRMPSYEDEPLQFSSGSFHGSITPLRPANAEAEVGVFKTSDGGTFAVCSACFDELVNEELLELYAD